MTPRLYVSSLGNRSKSYIDILVIVTCKIWLKMRQELKITVQV